MEQKIREYIDSVFRDVPHSERADNIRNEILQNLLDKYADLLKEGRTADEAYAIAISSGGDLSGIVADLRGESVKYNYNYEKQFDKMYEKQYKREKKKCSRFDSLLWPITVCLYLLYSLLVRGAWAYSWNLFIAASAVSSLYRFLTVKSNRKARRGALSSFVWTATVVVYFILSFATGRWDITWILFILAIAVSNIAEILVFHEEDEDEDEDEEEQKAKRRKRI